MPVVLVRSQFSSLSLHLFLSAIRSEEEGREVLPLLQFFFFLLVVRWRFREDFKGFCLFVNWVHSAPPESGFLTGSFLDHNNPTSNCCFLWMFRIFY